MIGEVKLSKANIQVAIFILCRARQRAGDVNWAVPTSDRNAALEPGQGVEY